MSREAVPNPKRQIVTMRMSDALRQRINEAASENSRSVSQEIESRLERSFQDDDVYGGASSSLLTKLVISSIAMIEIETEKSWTEDRMTWESVRAAIDSILSGFQPSLDDDTWQKSIKEFFDFISGVLKAAQYRDEIEGLTDAYKSSDTPNQVRDLIDQAWENYRNAFANVRVSARRLFEGPLSSHERRREQAVRLGREIAYRRTTTTTGTRGNTIVAGMARLFAVNGMFEPLSGLRDPDTITDEELLSCIRVLASQPAHDPDFDAEAFLNRGPDASDPQA